VLVICNADNETAWNLRQGFFVREANNLGRGCSTQTRQVILTKDAF
jgi:hypothetical protein